MKFLLYIILLGISSKSFSQSFFLGLNPPSVKWNQINTDKVQVVFPSKLESKAQRVSSLVHYLYDNAQYSIGNRTGKVSIILHGQSIIPNGFVSLLPFRSEFFTTPPQFSFAGPVDWVDLLAIHEYRHVQQFLNARKGITNLAYYFFGQGGWGTMAGMALPRWYFEGDATLTETVLTHGGRGRMPVFIKEYRALLLSGRNYNYEKFSARSIRDYVPDHYHLGYYMITHARREFGDDTWKQIVEDAVKYKGIFYPLSRNLRKKTGLSTKKLYRTTADKLREQWQKQAEQLSLTASTKINHFKKKHFTSYTNPIVVNDNNFIAEKSSFDQIKTYYYIDSLGQEKRIISPGNFTNLNAALSYNKGRLVWAQYSFDKRWANRVYTDIFTYNLSTRQKQRLSRHSKYFTPAFSNEGQYLVAVEVPDPNIQRLVILNAHTGKPIQILTSSHTDAFSFPKWTDDDQYIVAVAQNKSGNALIKVAIADGKVSYLTDYNTYQIANPFPRGKYVYFQAALSGIDNIYALDIETKRIFQVTSTLLGAYQPYVSEDGTYLLMSEFTALGFDLKKVSLQPETWKAVSAQDVHLPDFYQPLAEKEGGDILSSIPEEQYAVTGFRTKSNPFNFHTLQPNITPPNYSLTLFTQNKFSTVSGVLSANYNGNEQNFRYNASLWYGEYFPVLKTGFSFGNSRRGVELAIVDRISEGDTTAVISSLSNRWEEMQVQMGICLPLNLSAGVYTAGFTVDIDYNLRNVNYQNEFFAARRNGNFSTLGFDLRFSNSRRRTIKHVNPRWGQSFRLRYNTTLLSENNSGSRFQLDAALFFPGIFRSHSFFLTASTNTVNLTDSYSFSNIFVYPRGYSAVAYDNVQRLSFNYSLPVLYPDLALGSFAFIQRIRANFFYDVAKGTINAHNTRDIVLQSSLSIPPQSIARNDNNFFIQNTLRSVGVELLFDFRAVRLIDLSAGLRYSRLLESTAANVSPNRWELLVTSIRF